MRGTNRSCLKRNSRGKRTGAVLEAHFIDQAPDGFGSALSFFSDEAFRFYLPAYLMADIDGLLEQADPVFHLCHGLDDLSRSETVNPRRYGNRTWSDHAQHRFSMFTPTQAAAITDYLRFKRGSLFEGEFGADRITQAIKNYWDARARAQADCDGWRTLAVRAGQV